jgi:hypothetical protein
LIEAYRAVNHMLKNVAKMIDQIAREPPVCRRLMTATASDRLSLCHLSQLSIRLVAFVDPRMSEAISV